MFNDFSLTCVTDLIMSTASAMEYGQRAIRQTAQLGPMADNEDRPRETLEACKRIETIMLRLVEQVSDAVAQ